MLLYCRSAFRVVNKPLQQRALLSTQSDLNIEALDKWISSPPQATLDDTFTFEHLSDLYITLPTRDGTRKPYETPHHSQRLPYGHHLAFFHARQPESRLREDGTDEDISPPKPFLRRMWAGGSITWDNSNPLLIGHKAKAFSNVASAQKKGFEKGRPMVFITQRIELTVGGKSKPSVTEERAHVYFPENTEKKHGVREVKDLPSSADFTFRYTPTPVTLFRYSALMFNAHHIHLDPVYTQNKEGYAERLVHGPLTALMLLENVTFNNSDAQLKRFEYRATNPLIVNRELTLNGTWTSNNTATLWCVDQEGVVGMTGLVQLE
ncbi:hypothetical protein BDQ17DRAFT_1230949 [Cyathus striatus]|nr:hypothetical protein BDQ17DRAFT_1230949 [Cyathus striatus]